MHSNAWFQQREYISSANAQVPLLLARCDGNCGVCQRGDWPGPKSMQPKIEFFLARPSTESGNVQFPHGHQFLSLSLNLYFYEKIPNVWKVTGDKPATWKLHNSTHALVRELCLGCGIEVITKLYWTYYWPHLYRYLWENNTDWSNWFNEVYPLSSRQVLICIGPTSIIIMLWWKMCFLLPGLAWWTCSRLSWEEYKSASTLPAAGTQCSSAGGDWTEASGTPVPCN